MTEEKKGAEEIPGFGELLAKMAEARRTFEEEHGELQLQSEFEFPMEISGISIRTMPSGPGVGKLVRVRPVNDKKTYLGIHLGDLQREVMVARGSKSKQLMLTVRRNPAIWVPDLKKVVWGDSSWWGVIETPEDAERLITDGDIQNVWYVKALKELHAQKEGKTLCPKCNGTGVEYQPSPDTEGEDRPYTCPECDGDGVVKKEGGNGEQVG